MDERDLPAALRSFFEERPELGVASVYLFGSHARGEAHRESDIDVALLLRWDRYPNAGERFDARVRLGSELIHALRHNEVDVVVLNDAPPMLGREIIWTGQRVYLGDPAYPEIPREVLRDLQNLPGFRNVVAREYISLDFGKVLTALDHLQPVEELLAAVRRMEEGESGPPPSRP